MPHITTICNTTCNTTFSCSLPQSDPKYTVPLIVKVTQSRTIVYHALVSNIRLHTHTILHQRELYHPHHAKQICTMGCTCTSTCQSTVYHAIAHPGIQVWCTMPLPTGQCPVPILLSSIKTKVYHGLHQHMPKHGAPCHCPPWYPVSNDELAPPACTIVCRTITHDAKLW